MRAAEHSEQLIDKAMAHVGNALEADLHALEGWQPGRHTPRLRPAVERLAGPGQQAQGDDRLVELDARAVDAPGLQPSSTRSRAGDENSRSAGPAPTPWW